MYDELVNALRRLSDWSILDFEDNLSYANQIAEEAADAIEKLTAYVALYKDCAETAMKVAQEYYSEPSIRFTILRNAPKEANDGK